MKTLAALALISTVLAPRARAQEPDTAAVPLAAPGPALRLHIGGAGEGRYVQHRVDAGNGLELQSGNLFGGSGFIGIGSHVEIEAGGATGTLTADSANSFNATLARGEAHVAVLPVPWLALRAGGAIHTFSASFAKQRWVSLRMGGEARLAFVGGKLHGMVRFELYPVVSVSGLAKPSRAFGAASGMIFTSGVVVLSALYELERYDFQQLGGVTRREQLGTLVVGLGLRR